MIKKFGEFILEGKEHSFADKMYKMAMEHLSDEEQEQDKFYEKILDWAISFYDRKLVGKAITEDDYKECMSQILPKLSELRAKLSGKPAKKKKDDDDEDEEDD